MTITPAPSRPDADETIEGETALYRFTSLVEVQWADCDAAGIVFYPHFFRFMDIAFQRLLRSKETGQRELRRDHGILGTPLLEAGASFRSPARYDDTLVLDVAIAACTSKTLRITYRGRIADRAVFDGFEIRGFVMEGENGRLRGVKIPEAFKTRFGLPDAAVE